ncbi:hypothetical protein [Hufsiella ginkgonis]|uniref:Uncharacterized protein n=1 Tax=Hufsiella ginkgonis TaxID=2695274 RepID=A0A7K1Y0E1_9SPHI|nr:hypothetical protein [Hufsiella ginkgonis]MXV16751.1 hypothetical protein [Hufsiella ginkgonis]
MHHTFHIPVLGLGYSIDTPLKVARYGISSVVSIVDDELTERMRAFHCRENGREYVAIKKSDNDSRARRITAYLDLLRDLVNGQFMALKQEPFLTGSDICKYFELLPESSALKYRYNRMLNVRDRVERHRLQRQLRRDMVPGAIDVNIMAKVDKANPGAHAGFPATENTDALAALRGFAGSSLQSSVVVSAGLNTRLYSYFESFVDFYPDEHGRFKKKIILKVSDFRSAAIQAKMLAKRGLWVSEFRIESGLNCGGHAFATDGLLLGPILEEFKQQRSALRAELFGICRQALAGKQIAAGVIPPQRVTAQGGIGTAREHAFLLDYYQLDGTGWGSPFLLVPEATNVDAETLHNLGQATERDFYLSNSSPLGVLFNNFRKSTAEAQRLQRIEAGRPGSPCTKKFLCSNTEFTEAPICTASREYQYLKINELNEQQGLSEAEFAARLSSITEKVCLCEGLCASAYLVNGILKPKESEAVSICPGPNLAYFSSSYTLKEMVGHIYGRLDLLKDIGRAHVFINELNLYVNYLKQDLLNTVQVLDDKRKKHYDNFMKQLAGGIAYYGSLFLSIEAGAAAQAQLAQAEAELSALRLSDLWALA